MKNFDIFWFGESGPNWIEAVETLEIAKAHIEKLPESNSRGYSVLDHRTGNRISFAPKIRSWAVAGALRKPLSERDALDILWSLMGADNYRLFVTGRGWPPERYEKWLTATLKTLLFRKAPRMLSHK